MRFVIGLLMILCLALIGCNNDNGTQQAAAPTIVSMSISQVSIGQIDNSATIVGSNFVGVTSVQLGDGISVTGFTVNSSSEIVVNFDVLGSAQPGARTVTVSSPAGTASVSTLLTVLNNHVPVASFTITPRDGSTSSPVTFDASGSTDKEDNINGYHWVFGDGTIANGRKVEKKYNTVGSYTVVLTVTDKGGASDKAQKVLEISKNNPPIAKYKITPASGSGDTNTVFVADASLSRDTDGTIKDYIWDFGDGTKKVHAKIAEHTYAKAGKFTITLTVVDNAGGEGEAVAKVNVEKSTSQKCTGGAGSHGIIFGRVVGVEPGTVAVTNFGSGRTCSNTFHKCDDFRRADPEGFFGIVDKMDFRGNGVFGVHNQCPLHWPPGIGEKVFLIFKTCSQNHCP